MRTVPTFGVGVIGFGFMERTHSYGHINLLLFYDPVPCKTRLVGWSTSPPVRTRP